MIYRDEIKTVMADAISERSTAEWLGILQPADIWCSEVLDWPKMLESEAFKLLDMQQTIQRNGSVKLNALRGPIRIEGKTLKCDRAAPALGADQEKITNELLSIKQSVKGSLIKEPKNLNVSKLGS